MECNISEVRSKYAIAWYRQSFGKVPQFLVRPYSRTLGYTFVEGFTDSRFSVTVKDQKFDLNINEIREDDGGEYFCGYVDGNILKFTSGTRLQFEGEEMKPCPTPGTLNKNTHSVTHQGSNSRDGEGKTSDIKELQVKMVKHGEFVTMECNISRDRHRNNLFWYRQSFGELPQFLVRPYPGTLGYTFAEGFNDRRFSVTVKGQKFDLNINEIREDDGGEYFCGYVDGSTVKFTSGTCLQFEGEEMKPCPTPGTLNKNTHSVTHQGSNSSDGEGEEMKPCPTPGTLNKNTHSVTHQGSNSRDGEGEEMKPCLTPGTLNKNTHSVTHQGSNSSSSSSNHQTPTNQADDEDVLNYAAVNFAKKPSSSRTSRDTSHQDVYAQVKIK
ncbi:uncharacterized protein LOC128514753 [Clarias gariepinus]|uniref:uncharacterized protein LOC128514753 n=1 Tax=Clarias gariepinus TaxID=13013 RepID=UPI00234C479B|nr:uncharacterized protein LOC128514753 [Clarias gariepinus]